MGPNVFEPSGEHIRFQQTEKTRTCLLHIVLMRGISPLTRGSAILLCPHYGEIKFQLLHAGRNTEESGSSSIHEHGEARSLSLVLTVVVSLSVSIPHYLWTRLPIRPLSPDGKRKQNTLGPRAGRTAACLRLLRSFLRVAGTGPRGAILGPITVAVN